MGAERGLRDGRGKGRQEHGVPSRGIQKKKYSVVITKGLNGQSMGGWIRTSYRM